MLNAHFDLVTDWTIPAPSPIVWDALFEPQEWPSWWRAVEAVEILQLPDENGVGGYARLKWRTALLYRLTFNMRTVRVEPGRIIEGVADGDVAGTGRWTLQPAGDNTQVRYEWNVDVTHPVMRHIAPFTRPAIKWNHDVIMEWGRRDLIRQLGCDKIIS